MRASEQKIKQLFDLIAPIFQLTVENFVQQERERFFVRWNNFPVQYLLEHPDAACIIDMWPEKTISTQDAMEQGLFTPYAIPNIFPIAEYVFSVASSTSETEKGTVRIVVENGNSDEHPGRFAEHMEMSLANWFGDAHTISVREPVRKDKNMPHSLSGPAM